MKRFVVLLACVSQFSVLVAHNGDKSSAATPAQPVVTETPTADAALAPVAAQAPEAFADQPLVAPTAPVAETATRPVGTESLVAATAPVDVKAAKRMARKQTRLNRLVEKIDRMMTNNTTSILIGILIALAVVLAFAIDSTFGLVILLAGVIAALFILLR